MKIELKEIQAMLSSQTPANLQSMKVSREKLRFKDLMSTITEGINSKQANIMGRVLTEEEVLGIITEVAMVVTIKEEVIMITEVATTIEVEVVTTIIMVVMILVEETVIKEQMMIKRLTNKITELGSNVN